MRSLHIADIATPVGSWLSPDCSIREACTTVDNEHPHVALLGEPHRAVGVVSAGDIVEAIARNCNIDSENIASIATTELITIDATAGLMDCLKLFSSHPVRSIFVIKDEAIIGSVTKGAILARHSDILDEAVNAATAELQRAADQHDRMLGTAAHDIRNPLGVILAWCELLEEILAEDINLEVAEALETINKQAHHILEILNQFLDVAKIESGKVTLDISEFDPAEIIISAYKANVTRAQKKMVPLENRAPLSMPLIKGDRDRIQAAIEKLIHNAVKYSKAGEIARIEARTENKKLIVEISDKGQGIPLEEQERIFTAFAKTSSRPTAGETGTGLGLAIAKKVLEMHEGSLSVLSSPGEGSTFTIELPSL